MRRNGMVFCAWLAILTSLPAGMRSALASDNTEGARRHWEQAYDVATSFPRQSTEMQSRLLKNSFSAYYPKSIDKLSHKEKFVLGQLVTFLPEAERSRWIHRWAAELHPALLSLPSRAKDGAWKDRMNDFEAFASETTKVLATRLEQPFVSDEEFIQACKILVRFDFEQWHPSAKAIFKDLTPRIRTYCSKKPLDGFLELRLSIDASSPSQDPETDLAAALLRFATKPEPLSDTASINLGHGWWEHTEPFFEFYQNRSIDFVKLANALELNRVVGIPREEKRRLLMIFSSFTYHLKKPEVVEVFNAFLLKDLASSPSPFESALFDMLHLGYHLRNISPEVLEAGLSALVESSTDLEITNFAPGTLSDPAFVAALEAVKRRK